MGEWVSPTGDLFIKSCRWVRGSPPLVTRLSSLVGEAAFMGIYADCDLFIKSCWQGWLYGYSGSPLATRLLNLVGVGSGLQHQHWQHIQSCTGGGGGGGVLVFLTDSFIESHR